MRIPALILTFTAAVTVFAAPLNQHDRDRVLSELHASRKQYLDAIANLSPAQWTYKAGPDRWSIQEIAEHIIAAEGFIRDMVTVKVMSGPADPEKAEKRQPGNDQADEKFLAALRDRSQKATAPAEIVPKGIYKTPREAAETFKAAREKTLDYVRSTNDSLRDHFYSPLPGNELDAVQGLLLIAGHTERHVEQMEEVKQSPGYPKR